MLDVFKRNRSAVIEECSANFSSQSHDFSRKRSQSRATTAHGRLTAVWRNVDSLFVC